MGLKHIPVCQGLIFLSETPSMKQKRAWTRRSMMTALSLRESYARLRPMSDSGHVRPQLAVAVATLTPSLAAELIDPD